ncbi:MAG: fatty acyl-AMP ligase [Planctomycetota bacterium]|nr:fatty acyl-AMP ligase [Planctomycetota bacterium]
MPGVDSIPRLLYEDPAPNEDLAVSTLGPTDAPAVGLRRGRLLAEVERLAARLHAEGLAGRPVLIPERNGLEYAVAFLACLRMGAMAVTAHPPRAGGGGERLAAIVAHSRPAAVVASPGLLDTIDRTAPDLLADIPRIVLEVVGEDLEGEASPAIEAPAPDPTIPWPSPDAIGLLQYTSGSTRDPAPVALSQANLLANGVGMRDLFREPDSKRSPGDPRGGSICWMPLFHDMGLIGFFLCPLLMKVPVHFMQPEAFVMRPIRWLRAITNTEAVYSGGPCFAYDLCVERIPLEQRATIDLSSWRFAFNGAEPIRPSTVARFQAAFESRGFAGMLPCYGLAEHTLLVSIRRHVQPLRFHVADRTALDAGRLEVRRTVEVEGGQPGTGSAAVPLAKDEVGVVPCGPSIPGHEIVIRDPKDGRRLPEGAIGEVTLKGPSVATGYLARPEATAASFRPELDGEPGPWLRTGDLGVLHAGDLHVVGRLKDLIIVDGRNVHPADVEASLESAHPAIEGGRVAVVSMGGVLDERSKGIAAVAELARDTYRAWRRDPTLARASGALRAELCAVGSSVHGIRLARIVIVAPNALPRTTSGKIRRSETAAMLSNDDFEPLFEGDDSC